MASDMLRAQFLLAYSLDGAAPRLFRLNGRITMKTVGDLLQTGYVNPGGDRYACLTIDQELNVPLDMTVDAIEAVRIGVDKNVATGAPILVRWSDIFARSA